MHWLTREFLRTEDLGQTRLESLAHPAWSERTKHNKLDLLRNAVLELKRLVDNKAGQHDLNIISYGLADFIACAGYVENTVPAPRYIKKGKKDA